MKFKKLLAISMMICFGSQVLASGNTPGQVIGGVLMGGGLVGMIISGALMGAASSEEYCDIGTRRAVSGTYDCSYQTCAWWVSNGQTYYCQTYYSGATGGYVESCDWVDNGSTCMQWVTVPQTCNTYACQNANGVFTDFLHRKKQPQYDNSKYALIAMGATTGAGLLTLILSVFFPRSAADESRNPV